VNDHLWMRLIGAGLVVSTAACSVDNLLSVPTPDLVPASSIETPSNALLLVNSTINDFDCAFSNYAVAAGTIGPEIVWGDNNSFDLDRHTETASTGQWTGTCSGGVDQGGPAIYTALSIARGDGDRVHSLLSGWTDAQVPNRRALLATASAYAGYSYLLLGEAMCTAAIDLSAPLSRDSLWAIAVQRFSTAITEATAASNTSILVMAYAGRARARVNLGGITSGTTARNAATLAQAATDAGQVPAGYVQNATFAGVSWVSSNQTYQWITNQARATIDSSYWNLTYGGVPDPRVSLTFTGLQTLNGATLVEPNKYPNATAPQAIAKWSEAQLIIAEADLATGNTTGAIAVFNALHANAGLPPYSGATDATSVRTQLIDERRRELFLESQILEDLIRFQIPLTPPAGTPYPRGGGFYGSATCVPLPTIEGLGNPNAA
jgi:hypothetical protein